MKLLFLVFLVVCCSARPPADQVNDPTQDESTGDKQKIMLSSAIFLPMTILNKFARQIVHGRNDAIESVSKSNMYRGIFATIKFQSVAALMKYIYTTGTENNIEISEEFNNEVMDNCVRLSNAITTFFLELNKCEEMADHADQTENGLTIVEESKKISEKINNILTQFKDYHSTAQYFWDESSKRAIKCLNEFDQNVEQSLTYGQETLIKDMVGLAGKIKIDLAESYVVDQPPRQVMIFKQFLTEIVARIDLVVKLCVMYGQKGIPIQQQNNFNIKRERALIILNLVQVKQYLLDKNSDKIKSTLDLSENTRSAFISKLDKIIESFAEINENLLNLVEIVYWAKPIMAQDNAGIEIFMDVESASLQHAALYTKRVWENVDACGYSMPRKYTLISKQFSVLLRYYSTLFLIFRLNSRISENPDIRLTTADYNSMVSQCGLITSTTEILYNTINAPDDAANYATKEEEDALFDVGRIIRNQIHSIISTILQYDSSVVSHMARVSYYDTQSLERSNSMLNNWTDIKYPEFFIPLVKEARRISRGINKVYRSVDETRIPTSIYLTFIQTSYKIRRIKTIVEFIVERFIFWSQEDVSALNSHAQTITEAAELVRSTFITFDELANDLLVLMEAEDNSTITVDNNHFKWLDEFDKVDIHLLTFANAVCDLLKSEEPNYESGSDAAGSEATSVAIRRNSIMVDDILKMFPTQAKHGRTNSNTSYRRTQNWKNRSLLSEYFGQTSPDMDAWAL